MDSILAKGTAITVMFNIYWQMVRHLMKVRLVHHLMGRLFRLEQK